MGDTNRMDRSDLGAFVRSDLGARGPFGPKFLTGEQTSTFQSSILITEVLHEEADGTLLDTLVVDETFVFNQGLSKTLERVVDQSNAINVVPVCVGMTNISEVLRTDTLADHPGWDIYGAGNTQQLLGQLGISVVQTATGARINIGEQSAPPVAPLQRILINTASDADFAGIFCRWVQAPLNPAIFAFTLSTPLTVQAGGSFIRFKGFWDFDEP